MKILYWIIGIMAIILIGAYVLLFTGTGNGFLKPIIEKKIQEKTQLDSKLKTFSLSMSDVDVLLELSPKNNISLNGSYSIWSRSLDMKYNVDLNDVKSLKELFTQEIDTPLHLVGTAKGDSELLLVEGKSDISSSISTFEASLVEFEPKDVAVNVKSLKIKEALIILNQAPYTDGELDVVVNMRNVSDGLLTGTIDTKISKGVLNSKYLSKTYEFKQVMPHTTYNLMTHSVLDGNFVDTSLDLNSNLANLDVTQARYDIEEESLVSDYQVNVHDLDRLYFVTQRHLLGSIMAEGKVKKSEDLDLTMESYVAGGILNAKLHNNDLEAKIHDMKSRDILTILKYPKIFDARLDGKLDYNLKKQKGLFDGKLSDGKFSKNQAFDLLKQYAQTDMYKETFKGDVNAKINVEKIVASLTLRSRNASIITKDAKIDSKKSLIDSNIDISANGNDVKVSLKGDINKPDVKIDAGELLKKEGTKVIKKELGKILKGFF